MKLHEFTTEFKNLISVVAAYKHLPESAVERDYYIVLMLQKLADSEYAEKCVFKGGTSLSKCYPGFGYKISDKKTKGYCRCTRSFNPYYDKKYECLLKYNTKQTAEGIENRKFLCYI